MIKFKDWTITSDGLLARQYDNLSRRVEVTGELPEGWIWELLVQVGEVMDILPLSPMEGGVGHTLTADQLSLDGYYMVQLRGRMGEVVRHTNTTHVYVAKSLAGTGEWPTIPSEYSMVVTVREAEDASDYGVASHSAAEILEQIKRGWDVTLLVELPPDEIPSIIPMKPLGGYTEETEDGTAAVVLFQTALLLPEGFITLVVMVGDVTENGNTQTGIVVPVTMDEQSLVTSVNGKTGTVQLTAADVGALSQNQLQNGVNTALAQAKASGAFDGADGAPGPQGPAGADGTPGKDGAPGKDNLPNVEAVAGAEVALTLDNNVEYHCADAVTALTIQGFTPAEDGKVSMWAVQFTAGEGITVSVPEHVNWAVAEPVFTAGVGYWLSFVPLVSGDILGVWVSDEQTDL